MKEGCPGSIRFEGETARHPCYSFDAHGQFARMHLPVAPMCNISCNYCNRKYDCVNESRPGVTSELLNPVSAMVRFVRVKETMPHLSVVGIAGPGDALANWNAVKRTVWLIRDLSPDTMVCLSTNGLMLPAYAKELLRLGVKHITVTVNCLDPEIGAKIYSRVRYEDKELTGEEGASLLIRNQLEGIRLLSEGGAIVKVNCVMIKGINDTHIPEVVKKVKSLGAVLTNIMPLIPAPGSVFEAFPQTSMKDLNGLRSRCEEDLPQMRHCRQCRADAVGLLSEDRSHEFRDTAAIPLKRAASGPGTTYRVAVASKEQKRVDLHYGHADEFYIYDVDGVKSLFVEKRHVNKYCEGVEDCGGEEKDSVVEAISDCNAVLSMRTGHEARMRLAQHGITAVESCTAIDEGLVHAYYTLKRAEERLKAASG